MGVSKPAANVCVGIGVGVGVGVGFGVGVGAGGFAVARAHPITVAAAITTIVFDFLKRLVIGYMVIVIYIYTMYYESQTDKIMKIRWTPRPFRVTSPYRSKENATAW
jgi:hypothetical protein